MSELFNELLPPGAEVVLKIEAGRQRLIVRHSRPRPDWLLKYAFKARKALAGRGKGGGATALPDAVIDAGLVQLVRAQPGHARTYYERLTVSAGGIGFSQERKEAAVDRLLAAGVLVKVPLPRPRGRANHYLEVARDPPTANLTKTETV